MGGVMIIKIRLADGRTYQLDGVEAEKTDGQLENDFLDIEHDGWDIRIYRKHIVSVEWKWVE